MSVENSDEEDLPITEKAWLDDSKNVDKIAYALYISCALLVLVDLVYHKHGHFDFEEWIGFYGFYGFLGSVSLVLAAKGMRLFLMRDESFYDQD